MYTYESLKELYKTDKVAFEKRVKELKTEMIESPHNPALLESTQRLLDMHLKAYGRDE